MNEVTRVLPAMEQSEPQAAEQLLPLVYDELRRLAVAQMAHFESRRHFFAAAAAMRRMLMEKAWRKQRQKRGSRRARTPLNQIDAATPDFSEDLLANLSSGASLRHSTADRTRARSPAQEPGVGVQLRTAARVRRLEPVIQCGPIDHPTSKA